MRSRRPPDPSRRTSGEAEESVCTSRRVDALHLAEVVHRERLEAAVEEQVAVDVRRRARRAVQGRAVAADHERRGGDGRGARPGVLEEIRRELPAVGEGQAPGSLERVRGNRVELAVRALEVSIALFVAAVGEAEAVVLSRAGGIRRQARERQRSGRERAHRRARVRRAEPA